MIQNMQKDKTKKTKIIVKAPTQERSRQTVATILEACSRLLVSEGFFSITTDKIAKEAGVSIGSLYQFFGNKESVVQAVVKQLMEEDKRIANEKMKSISPLPADQKARALIELAFEICRRNFELRSKLTTIQYYVTDANYVSDFIRFFQDVLKENLPAIPGKDMNLVCNLIVNAFIGLVNTMAIDNPNYINDQALLGEITQLFFKYLGIETTASAS
ncbi:MAG TPA: TetR/AcrR family transcriptional regulator [Bdellovibrio sp.]|nr:TetR/AcrR family transcriptional regulator [Bdellovibrio sp.]